MPVESYVIGKAIGKGSYGEVKLATNRKDKKKVCHLYTVHFNFIMIFKFKNQNKIDLDTEGCIQIN